MAKERLHVANVVRVLEHGDGGGAAEVVQGELARDAERAAERGEFAVER